MEAFFGEHVPAWCKTRDAAKAAKVDAQKAAQACNGQPETEQEGTVLGFNTAPLAPLPIS